ncbi:hypothetical protein [Pantoea dispersa]
MGHTCPSSSPFWPSPDEFVQWCKLYD